MGDPSVGAAAEPALSLMGKRHVSRLGWPGLLDNTGSWALEWAEWISP